MRIIGHLDMDAFFAAVEERDKPYLQGLPVVVGADPLGGTGRGVVSTANYMARTYGIHSAMPISRAWHLAEEAKRQGKPQTIFITPHFGRYDKASRHVMDIIQKYVPDIEVASVDEAYLDLTFTGSFKEAEMVCRAIKNEINKNEHLTASVGIGPNKLVAKIASDINKPDGLTVVTESEAERFLAPLPLRKISGIGPKTDELFARINVRTIGDARKFSKEELIEMQGTWGAELYEKLRGIDNTPLTKPGLPKSIGEQETFEKDTHDLSIMLPSIEGMVHRIWKHLAQYSFRGFKTLVVTVRFEDFKTVSRTHTFNEPIVSEKIFEREALARLLLFLDQRENPHKKQIRLIGIRAEKLKSA